MRVSCDREVEAVWRVQLAPPADGGETLIDREGVTELLRVLEASEADHACRVLVIEGACKGLDLAGLIPASGEAGDLREQVHRFAACLTRLQGSTKVVISTVDGDAAGGGVGIAAAADLLIATSRSTFGLPELVLGLIPSLVLPLLMQRMPTQRARRLCLSGTSVGAGEAQALGLVDQVVDPPDDLERSLRQVLKQVLRMHPGSISGLKELQAQILDRPCPEALSIGADRTSDLLEDPDRIAAARAFLEGERPPWFDRYRPSRTRSQQ
jgi:enoyl-CoA hydratase/carnithine racemase